MRTFGPCQTTSIRRYFFILFFILCLVACRKTDSLSEPPAETLMRYAWYPYSSQVIRIDSTTTMVVDQQGNTQSKNTSVTSTDTLFLFSNCTQQSSLRFQQNGISAFKDMCNAIQGEVTSSWTITQTNMLSFPCISNSLTGYNRYYLTGGQLTEISHSQFTFKTAGSLYWFTNTDGQNGSKVYETHRVAISEIITYKSR